MLKKYFSSLKTARKDTNMSTMSALIQEDDVYVDEYEEPLDLDLEMQLEIAQLKIRYTQRMRNMVAEKQITGQAMRSMTADGKIVVCTGDDRVVPDDGSTGAVSPLPGLLHAASCVACGLPANAFCARCGVTPYCSASCQRRDWPRRHRAVCHNLARAAETAVDVAKIDQVDVEAKPSPPRADLSQPAPLRRPRNDNAPQRRNDDAASRRNDDSASRRNDDSASRRNDDASSRRNDDAPSRRNDDSASRRNDDASSRRNDDSASRRNDDSASRRNDDDAASRRSGDDNDRQGKPFNQNGYKQFNKNQTSPNHQNQAGNRNQANRNPNAGKENVNRSEGRRQPGMRPPLRHETEVVECSAKQEPKPNAPPQYPPLPTNYSKPVNDVQKPTNVAQQPSNVVKSPIMNPPVFAKSSSPVTRVNGAESAPAQKEHPLMALKCLTSLLADGATLAATVQEPCGTGYVCGVLHEDFGESFELLCEPYSAACEEDKRPFTPSPGALFSYYLPEDGGWYRALCLAADRAALLDAGREVSLAGSRVVRLPAEYKVQPVFAAVLTAEGLKPGELVTCTITRRSAGVCHVTLAGAGAGTLARWLPAVQQPAPEPQPEQSPVAAAAAAPAGPAPVPSVPRPDVRHGSEVTILEVTKEGALVVRETSDREFDLTVADVLMRGRKAAPLASPPTQGALVLARYPDGNAYRALVARTSVKANKFLIEYVEYGNTDVTKLENLLECPDDLSLAARPTRAARVTLHGVTLALTEPARQYLVKLKQEELSATLTLPDGATTAPSGSAVTLTLARGDSVNKQVREMSTPEWLALQDSGADLLKTRVMMMSDLTYMPLPEDGCTLQVLDSSMLEVGALSACDLSLAADALAKLDELTQQMTEYCESEIGRQPYLPRPEELCIAKFEGGWYRAVTCEQEGGPGGATVSVLYVDYGNMSPVPVGELRKILPTQVEMPAIAVSVEIRDFPASPSPAAVAAARAHIAAAGGTLRVARANKIDPGSYTVSAPGLIAAMHAS